MALTPGTKLGTYEIQSPLGAGGMGEVYRATDTKLGRDVALKVLPAEMAEDPERLGRFRREAKTLAQLDHPNIVTIYSVEESDGVHFLTMQLVDGQPLNRLISPDGLPIERIVEIAGALADALAAAHEKGIVHRDLKPANVMVSNEGRVTVLDFGLAKDVRTAHLSDATLTSDSRTQVGVIMGTPAYMSPEQTSGRPLDHRTDIFSFGVVLHEMATGRRPFEGTSSAELVSAILRDTPPSVTDLRSDLPADLARIIRRCLEKDPRYRMQTARDVSNEFRDLARITTRPAPVSSPAHAADSGATRADEGFCVAVLPFKYTGSNQDLKGLAEGLSEEVVTGLSRFSYLRVIARGSTGKYSNVSGDVRSIGKELGARYVMEGSLRQAGSKLRLAVQLVDTVSGAHLWAENYERSFSPETVFEIQDDLVPRIVATVADAHGVLHRAMSQAVRSKSPTELTAYEALLRTLTFAERISAEEHIIARTCAERAVQLAPNFSQAWAVLAQVYAAEYGHLLNPQPEPLERALKAAQRAVDADPSNAGGHCALAYVLFLRKHFQAFRIAAEQALELNPYAAAEGAVLGLCMAYSGDWERGCAVVERAMQINPRLPGWCRFPAFYNAYRKQDYQDAIRIGLKLNLPGLPAAHSAMAAAYGQAGDLPAARKELQELRRVMPNTADVLERIRRWQLPEMTEHIVDGLRKAGLEITDDAAKSASTKSVEIASVTGSGATRAEEGFWVAVLPFKYTGGNQDLQALSEGLSEEVITGLSRFSYLRVIARGSSAKYSSESGDVRAIGKELGARYVMEGSLRQAGSKLRFAVQLVEATTGSHLWAETYERAFPSESVFELQDELVPRIVSTVADRHGVLPHSMSEAVRAKDLEQLTPYEAVLLSFSYAERITSDEQIAAKACLERAVVQVPGYADAWAMLAMLFCDEYGLGFTVEFSLLERALEAARRAVKAGPSNHLAYQNLAYAHFLRREHAPCRNAAERSLALNSMDGSNVWFMGLVMAYMGDWERGCALIDRAMQLNPNFPGKYRYPLVANAYRKGDYKGALNEALRMNMPDVFFTPLLIAAAHGQLGEKKAAEKALRDLLVLKPNIAAIARESLGKWFQPELVEQLIEGLARAGLDVADLGATPASKPAVTATGESRADEGFWVGVLPFKYTGGNADLKALAEGLSEEVITGLSRFSYLRVIARGSTAKHASESGDIRTIGKKLGAHYVMEGSLRQAGNKLRLAIQLADTVSGAHLWAETYERAFTPESVFEVQDNLVPCIVSSVADMNGVLVRSMSEAVRRRDPEQLSPYEAVLRGFGYGTRGTAEELSTALSALELAVKKVPSYADAWGALAQLYGQDYAQGFNLHSDSLERGLSAAQRAVELAPTSYLGYCGLAQALFFQREFQSFRNAAERAVALNPMDGNSVAFLGELLTYTGDSERGLALAGRAKQLNPAHPGWYWYADFYHAYRKGDYRGALSFVLKVNMPGHWFSHAALAAAYGQLGEQSSAAKAVRDLVRVRPDFAATARKDIEKWWEPEYVERLVEGWRKAGLEIASDPANISTPPATVAGATGSGTTRTDEGFWVAALPFKYTGSNADLKALAEGLSEEIITGFSRFSYLRVIARGSAAKYSSESGDVRAIGKELGARYVMEGSVRQTGARVRVMVQLSDTAGGVQLWTETYERPFDSEAVFNLQDDLVPRIVSTVADSYGVLPHTMSLAVRRKDPALLTPYEALLRSFSYAERVTAEEHIAAKAALKRAVEQAPNSSDCWAMLSILQTDGNIHGLDPAPDSLDDALQSAQRAVDIAPTNHKAYQALAWVRYFRKEFQPSQKAGERAIALNPMDGGALVYVGQTIAFAGDWERGCSLVLRATQLNPNHAGWYWYTPFLNAYRKNDYRAALDFALKINMPGFPLACIALAAAHGQLGEADPAQCALRELLKLRPSYASLARAELRKIWDDQLVEHLIDGLRKAGLQIPSELGTAAQKSEAH